MTLALAPPRRPKELQANWGYGFAIKPKAPGVYVPSTPITTLLTGQPWEYNQISLAWNGPLPGQAPGDYVEVQISTDGGTTWEENHRVIPYTDIQTGASQFFADMAGYDASTTYHFRVRWFRWTWPDLTYGDFTNVAEVTTPAYVQSGTTFSNGEVRIIDSLADWQFWNNMSSQNVVLGPARYKWGDILELNATYPSFSQLSVNSPSSAPPNPGKWVTIRSAGYDTSGLRYDKRATLADKANMATVWVDNVSAGNAFGTMAGVALNPRPANYITVEGVHFEVRQSGSIMSNGAVSLNSNGSGSTHVADLTAQFPTDVEQLAALSSHVEFHRCVMDKTSNTQNSNDGVNSDGFFVVLKDCHIVGGSRNDADETHGVAARTGIYQMVDNCYVSAASIPCFMSSPSGIAVLNNNGCHWKRNYITREPEWKAAPSTYGLKNLWESKRSVECIVDRNTMEFNFYGSNQQASILFTPKQTAEAGATWRGMRFTRNVLIDLTRGFLIANDVGAGAGILAANHVVVEHNIIRGIKGPNSTPFNEATWFVEITGDSGSAPDVGLLAYWPMSEGAGTTTADTTGNGHTGTLVGATWGVGKTGNGVVLDGVNDYVNTGNWDIVSGGMSIVVWFKADDFDVNDGRIVSKSIGVNEQDHYWMMSTILDPADSQIKLRFRLKAGGTTTTLVASTGNIIQAGQWTHGVATYDGATMKIYHNGILVGSTAKTGAVDTNAAVAVRMGTNADGTKPFDGTIDEVRIYSRGLTQSEVTTLFQG